MRSNRKNGEHTAFPNRLVAQSQLSHSRLHSSARRDRVNKHPARRFACASHAPYFCNSWLRLSFAPCSLAKSFQYLMINTKDKEAEYLSVHLIRTPIDPASIGQQRAFRPTFAQGAESTSSFLALLDSSAFEALLGDVGSLHKFYSVSKKRNDRVRTVVPLLHAPISAVPSSLCSVFQSAVTLLADASLPRPF